MVVTYAPQYITGEPQFRQPTPSEKDKIRMNLTLGMFLLFIGGVVFMIWAGSELATYSYLGGLSADQMKEELGHAYINASQADLDMVLLTHLMAGIILLVFAIIGFLMGFLVKLKAIDPINKGEFEESGRFLNIFVIMGFIFGLVLAGIFIYKAKALLKSTAVRVDPTATTMDQSMYIGRDRSGPEVKRCPVCNTMMTFNAQTTMWYCPQCGRYQ